MRLNVLDLSSMANQYIAAIASTRNEQLSQPSVPVDVLVPVRSVAATTEQLLCYHSVIPIT